VDRTCTVFGKLRAKLSITALLGAFEGATEKIAPIQLVWLVELIEFGSSNVWFFVASHVVSAVDAVARRLAERFMGKVPKKFIKLL
jgi:hypothetical protein